MGIVLDPDQAHGGVANDGDEGDAAPIMGAPGTPPEMAARFAIMIEEGHSALDHQAAPA